MLSLKFNSEKGNLTEIKPVLYISCCDLFVKLSVRGFRWQTSLVVLLCRTWHLHGWMHLNGSNISPSLSFWCCHWLSVFCCRDNHGCHQRSQMKGGLYPHLCPSLLTPLSLSLPLTVISQPSPHVNNEHSHPPVPTNLSTASFPVKLKIS